MCSFRSKHNDKKVNNDIKGNDNKENATPLFSLNTLHTHTDITKSNQKSSKKPTPYKKSNKKEKRLFGLSNYSYLFDYVESSKKKNDRLLNSIRNINFNNSIESDFSNYQTKNRNSNKEMNIFNFCNSKLLVSIIYKCRKKQLIDHIVIEYL